MSLFLPGQPGEPWQERAPMTLSILTDVVELDESAENALVAIAQNLGFLVTQEEAAALSAILDAAEARGAVALTEAKRATGARPSRTDALIMHSSLVIAQQRKDPLFARYAQASEIKSRVRQVIMKKYASQAAQTARKVLADAGKRNMVDVSASKHFNAANRHSEVPKPRHAEAS